MDNLSQLRLLVRMNERLGVETDQATFDKIAAEEARIAAEQRKQQQIQEERSTAFKSLFADLSSELGKLMAEEKKKTQEEQQLLDRFSAVLDNMGDLQQQVAEPAVEQIPVTEEAQHFIEEQKTSQPSLVEAVVKQVAETTKPPSMFVQPEPPTVGRDIQDIQRKLKLLEGWVSKIAMTGPGGGAGSVDQLDHKTQVVVSDSYTVKRHDYYIGVDYPGNVAVYLPTTVNNGRVLVIKDESGNAAHYPITVVGRVDNDPDGFILKVNNGAVQLIYSNGWRII